MYKNILPNSNQKLTKSQNAQYAFISMALSAFLCSDESRFDDFVIVVEESRTPASGATGDGGRLSASSSSSSDTDSSSSSSSSSSSESSDSDAG